MLAIFRLSVASDMYFHAFLLLLNLLTAASLRSDRSALNDLELGVHAAHAAALSGNAANSSARQGIIILMAAAGAFSSGGGGGSYGGGYGHGGRYYAPSPPPEPPRWTRMPMGCDNRYNTGLCEVTLLQSACQAKHGKVKGVTVEDACQKVSPKKTTLVGSGLEPLNYYCQAAAQDVGVKTAAERLADLVPDDPDVCKVNNLEHLETLRGVKPAGRVKLADHYYLLYELTKDKGMEPLARAVNEFCKKRTTQEPDGTPDGLQYGFCRSDIRAGQDCTFFHGMREGWTNDYGKDFCNSLPQEAGKFRCLAFRKQLVQIAQAQSIFGTAKFSNFDEVIRLSPQADCPNDFLPAAPTEYTDGDASEFDD